MRFGAAVCVIGGMDGLLALVLELRSLAAREHAKKLTFAAEDGVRIVVKRGGRRVLVGTKEEMADVTAALDAMSPAVVEDSNGQEGGR